MKKTLSIIVAMLACVGIVMADWPADTNAWPAPKGTCIGFGAYAMETGCVAIADGKGLAWTSNGVFQAVQIGAGCNQISGTIKFRNTTIVNADGSVGVDGTLYTAVTGEIARATAAEAILRLVTTNAGVAKIVANKGVVSKTGSHLQVEYGAATNGQTITWSEVFAGTPAAVASYGGNATRATNLYGTASAQAVLVNSTNCTVYGDAVGATSTHYIEVIAVGVSN